MTEDKFTTIKRGGVTSILPERDARRLLNQNIGFIEVKDEPTTEKSADEQVEEAVAKTPGKRGGK